MEAIFGYGSLILPMSVIGRFDEELGRKTREIRENGGGPGEFLDFYMKDERKDNWKAYEINFVPVKIYGLERYYSLEHYEGGNMLVAAEASEEDFINGVAIFPLNEKQFEGITETEKHYKTLEKSREDIESYIPEKKLEEEGLELPEMVKVYVGREGLEDINRDTEKTRLESYHQYVFKGIEVLAERWFEDEKMEKELVEKFSRDFRETTFEKDEGGDWKRLSEK